MFQKYVLCRPDAGFNDTLCQIEMAYYYARQTNRIVIVDTGYEKSFHFHDKFSNYFLSRDSQLRLDPDFIWNSLDAMDVAPSALRGRLTSYTPQWSAEIDNFVDSSTGTPISFDLTRHYDEDILVRHTCGGSSISIHALEKLILRDHITDLLAQRITSIGRPFSAVHIRNTDYKSDYYNVIQDMKDSILLPVFIATDSLQCRKYCEAIFGRQNVIYFSELPDEEAPIHINKNFRSPFDRNSEAILDLLTLSLSNEYYKIPVRNDRQLEMYSGFSNLAENLMKNSEILISLLGRTNSASAIIDTVTAWQRPTWQHARPQI